MSFGDDTLHPDNVAPVTCGSCGREKPLWSNCFRPKGECPMRSPDASPPERPAIRIISVTEPGYEVTLFFNEEGGAHAIITRPNDKPTGINIVPPGPGRRIVVERKGNTFEVLYKDAP